MGPTMIQKTEADFILDDQNFIIERAVLCERLMEEESEHVFYGDLEEAAVCAEEAEIQAAYAFAVATW